MLDIVLEAAAWDPLGMAKEDSLSVSEALRNEVRLLNECIAELRGEAADRDRELQNLRKTISRQEKRRRSQESDGRTPSSASPSPAACAYGAPDGGEIQPPVASAYRCPAPLFEKCGLEFTVGLF